MIIVTIFEDGSFAESQPGDVGTPMTFQDGTSWETIDAAVAHVVDTSPFIGETEEINNVWN